MRVLSTALVLAGLGACAAGAQPTQSAGRDAGRTGEHAGNHFFSPEGGFAAVRRASVRDGAVGNDTRPVISGHSPDGLKFAQADQAPSIKDRFPDYKPKKTPDTLTDYRPSLADEVAALPAAEAENLGKLIDALTRWSRKADKNPGAWEEGNIALGANPKEYVPSDPELMVSEICERIRHIVLHTDAGKLGDALVAQKIRARKIVYQRFTFRHVDVMGSGRFFYALPPQRAVIRIKTVAE